MTQVFPAVGWLRAPLVVLSDRRPAPGIPRTGLESAIEWALREYDGVWLARHAGSEKALTDTEIGSCNGEWSALGGVAAQPRSSAEEWTLYVRANTSYAERIIEQISPGGAVWINGHRWLLVASMLREYGHCGPIGLLLDVPFPAPGQLEALPWYGDVMAALCRLDLVGFRTSECVGNFEACRTQAGRARPLSEVFPDGAEWATATDPTEWVTSFLHLLVSVGHRDLRRTVIE